MFFSRFEYHMFYILYPFVTCLLTVPHIRGNIRISAKEILGYCELNQHKPWLYGGCPKLLVQRKQAKLKWIRIQAK
jgi:hypothetical protein